MMCCDVIRCGWNGTGGGDDDDGALLREEMCELCER